MGSTVGDFGKSGSHKQCTAMSKRSGVQCKGVAVATSQNQKCRMHGGTAKIGAADPSFKSGRYSKHLPSRLDELYREARSNPEILDMTEHIALLEARMQEILNESTAQGTAPKWADIAEIFAEIETSLLRAETDKVMAGMERMHKILDDGIRWDKTWVQVTEIMEQLRKMTDTDIKRKKELNLMVPVERVIILMAAVGTAVKRHVTNPEEIDAVYHELEMLQGNQVPARPNIERVGPGVIDVGLSVRQIRGKRVHDAS